MWSFPSERTSLLMSQLHPVLFLLWHPVVPALQSSQLLPGLLLDQGGLGMACWYLVFLVPLQSIKSVKALDASFFTYFSAQKVESIKVLFFPMDFLQSTLAFTLVAVENWPACN